MKDTKIKELFISIKKKYIDESLDGMLSVAAIDGSRVEDLSLIESLLLQQKDVVELISSGENDGCTSFQFRKKLFSMNFYLPGLVEIDFNLREVKVPDDLRDIIFLLSLISEKIGKDIRVFSEGGEPYFFTVCSSSLKVE
jgi:hypothetical protein